MTRAMTLLMLSALLLPRLAEAQSTEEYRVRPGDTCGRIARAHYGHSGRYRLIHDANPELGAMPHHLTAGQILRLPVVEATPSVMATVTSTRRTVRHQSESQRSWTPSRVGQDLDRGWRLSTGESSTAELSFRRSSTALIREQTLIVVFGTGARRVRQEGSRAQLREGSMLSRLGSLSGSDPEEPLEVETPSALATLREGESQVDVDASGATRVTVHNGSAATVTSTNGGGGVEVQPGQGTTVEPGRRPRPPRPLPRAPHWDDGPRRFVGLRVGGGTVRGSWREVRRARSYRVEIARREDGRSLISSTVVPATVREVELHRLPPGTYYARVSTIDEEHFEGRPARALTFTVVAAEMTAPGVAEAATRPADDLLGLATLDDGLGDLDLVAPSGQPPQVPRYATLTLPDDVRCRFGSSDPVRSLRLVDVGPLELSCEAGGEALGGLALNVVSSSATILDARSQSIEALPRESTSIRVAVDPPIEDVSGLTLLAPPRVTVGEVSPHPDGGLRATIVVEPDFDASALALHVVTADRERLPIAEAEIAVNPMPPEARAIGAAPTDRNAAELAGPRGLPEAFGLAAYASTVGLRDERRSGSGMSLAVSFASASAGDDDPQLRITTAARAALFDDYLRLDVAVPADLMGDTSRTSQLGSRDLYLAAGSRVLSEGMIGLAFEAGVWAPTAAASGLDRARLQVAGDFSLRFLEQDRLAVRSRQAAIFDLTANGSMLWASAYGFDVWIAGPLSAGLELDLALGTEDGRGWVSAAVGGGVVVDLGMVAIHAAGRVAFGDEAFFGLGSGTIAVRGSFR